MEQILYKKTYQEYKAELDTELSKTAEGFVRIGYLLKVARDTNVLEESPYQTVTEFAKAEYGIDKTMVSRFISINDRFSEGGYSDQLQEQYRSYGYAKLTLMLALPDEINQELSPSYSKAEIQAIKNEVDEEKAISDLEVMLEPRPVPAPADGLLNMLIRQLGEDSPELYLQMAAIMNLEDQQEWTRKAKETLAPDAEKQYSIRISGTGRFLVSIRESEDTITTTSLRSLEKASYTYQDLRDAWSLLIPTGESAETDYRETWEKLYHKEFPGKAKVAPVQQPGKPKKTESKPLPRKESKVQKAPKPKPTKETPPAKEIPPAPEPEKPESTSTEPIPEEPERMPTLESEIVEEKEEQPEENTQVQISAEEQQLPGQIDIEEAIEEAEERQGATSYIEPEDPTLAAGQEPEQSQNTEEYMKFRPGTWVINRWNPPGDLKIPRMITRWLGKGYWEVCHLGETETILQTEYVEFCSGIQLKSGWYYQKYPKSIGTVIGRSASEDGWDTKWDDGIIRCIPDREMEHFKALLPSNPREDLDDDWERQKSVINVYVRSMTAETPDRTSLNKRLSLISSDELRTLRREFIDMAALAERELMYRREEF